MSDTSQILSLPFIQPSQAQKHVTHNEALRVLDAIVQLSVISATFNAPPAAPAPGDCYIIAGPAAGAWTGHEAQIAVYGDGTWFFVTPRAGWQAQVLNPKGSIVFDANAGWEASASGGAVQSTPQLGINTGADAVNRLSVSSEAVLFNHAGAGHQLKLNKAAAPDTVSLLYQTGFSGRAEMGLAGDDAFAIKVSADGAAWQEALRIDPVSARLVIEQPLAGDAVTQSTTDTTPNRVIRAQDGYVKGSIVGNVGQAGGVPTGAVIEQGTNPNGHYVRFADGTQICTHIVTAAYNSEEKLGVRWTFPAGFSELPNCTGLLWVANMPTEITPPISDITGVLRGGSNGSLCDFLVYRVTGGTDFIAGDTTPIQVTAIGRWF